MKIGFPTFILQGGRSGLSSYVCNLLQALQAEDHEHQYDLFMTQSEADLISLTNPSFTKRLYASSINQPLANLLWHNLCLPLKKYDLLHIPSARRIPMLKRTHIVATVHDLAAFSVEGKYDPARMYFNRHIVPAMIRRADHVIAVSQSTRDDLVRWTGYPADAITVIPSGIDHTLFRPAPKDEARKQLHLLHGIDRPFFIYVSRLEHPAKNHIHLIEAFERFKQHHPSPHQLLLAGADWSRADRIHARIAESAVRDDIRLLGFVPAHHLPLLYSGCELMVFPSLFEGFGLPIVEAMACGAPVICSNTSAMKELAGDLLPTFDPGDVEMIYLTMHSAVADGFSPEKRARGMEVAAGFDWKNTARRVKELYEMIA